MQIRKFFCKGVREGLQRVKRELGPDAMILQCRKARRRGFSGLFAPPGIEIIAAHDGASSPNIGENSAPEIKASSGRALPGTTRMEQREATSGTGERKPVETTGTLPASRNRFHLWQALLERHDLDPVLLEAILAELENNPADLFIPAPEKTALTLVEETIRRIPRCNEKTNRIKVLTGPTGVGKTTTLAKLAARYSLFHREKVGLITVDHYRVGAIEQLSTYAGIIGLPVETVLTPEELPAALARLEGCRHILVDTAGQSTGNPEKIADLYAYIEQLLPAEVFLVVSATTRRQDLQLIADSFSVLHYNRLIVTKMDETGSFGALLNAPYYTDCALVYLTDGQSVPEDLQLARETNLESLFFPGGGETDWTTRLKSCGSMPPR